MGNDKKIRAIPEITLNSIEEDSPDVEKPSPEARLKKIKVERAEARKDADSNYARSRDMGVTIAGLALVFVLIIMYFIAVVYFPDNEHISSLLDLIKAVVMLIIGYIFGTKITQR